MSESNKILRGKTEICSYTKVGKDLFPDLIARGFPAVYWGGAWRAHTDNIDTWMRAATIPSGPQQDLPDQENA